MALGIFAGTASAATIVVESDLDTLPAADAFCTLREAVHVANTNDAAGGLGGGNLGCEADNAGLDTIQLTAGHIYQLDLYFSHEDANIWGDLDMAGPTTITTVGNGLAEIRGKTAAGDKDRVLHALSTAGSVTLNRVVVSNGFLNVADAGDALDSGGGGVRADTSLTVIDSEITDNAVAIPSLNVFGGGIYAKGPLGKLTMRGSTVEGNTVNATNNQVIGAGIAVYGTGSAAEIANTTISGNTSTGSVTDPGYVGGAFLGDGTAATPSPVTLTNTTITDNTATAGGAAVGGLQIYTGTMNGNLVAGNTADSNPVDCIGGPETSDGNLIGNTSVVHCQLTGPNDQVGTNLSPIPPNIGALTDNGGPTRTHALNPGSPAIDAAGPNGPTTDQRGVSRPQGSACDIGAFELASTPMPGFNCAGLIPLPPPASGGASPTAAVPAAGPTGQRAAALKRCKKKKGKARKKCKKKALKLPL